MVNRIMKISELQIEARFCYHYEKNKKTKPNELFYKFK